MLNILAQQTGYTSERERQISLSHKNTHQTTEEEAYNSNEEYNIILKTIKNMSLFHIFKKI